MNNYRTIQQKDMQRLFPAWEKNIPTLGIKNSQPGNKTGLRFAISLLLMFVLGFITAWGQTGYSGTYYIGNYNNKGYNVETPANNYYLVPAANPQQTHQIDAYYSANYGNEDGDPNQPFLTTYKTNKDANSVWILEASGESGFYYIKHQSTGRYVIYDPVFTGDNSRRKSVHLTTGALDDKAKFAISISNPGYAIRPKSVSSGHRFFNAAGGNIDFYYSNGPTTGNVTYYNGLVGLFSDAADKNGIWYLEIPKPTISQDPTTLKISMSCELTGVVIRYTTDGKEPTKNSTLYEGEFLPEIGTGVFKAKAFNSSGDIASAMTTFELTKNAAPTISLNWNDKQVTISSTVEGGTIFYTTNGNNPTVSSSEYSGPISFNKPTTFKAIVGKVGYAPSTVTTRDVIKVVTPTIYDNGNVAIAITTATTGASIYYTTDGSTPTRSSSIYSAPLTNMEGKTIKAFAVKANNFDSDVATFGPVSFSCAQPIIRRTGADKFTITCSKPQSGVTIYYTTNGSTPSTSDSHVASGEAITFDTSLLPFTVKAIAVADGFLNSSEASLTISNDGLSGSGTPADPYQIALNSDYSIFATKVNTGGEASACYIVTSNIDASGAAVITTPFTGTFDGNGYTISNLGHALFNTVSGGTVKNVILDAVGIGSGTNVGSIANEAIGTSANKASIYNCGVLSGSVSGSGYVGSIVGKLGESTADNCYARVINCYSYATIGGGSSVGGIVGYNSFASAANNLRTMVMNCMYYGKITGGSNKAPIYNGENITNVGTNGLANYNYYFSGCTFTGGIDTYNCALAADERYLTRFEFYRRMLNSNGELAAWYAIGSTENRSEMYKWILLPSSYGTEHPFPVLAPQGIYPSVINLDTDNAPTTDEPNKGRNMGKLSVTIQSGNGGAQFTAPTGASIKTTHLDLTITDKDYDHFNYNYRKVQLPYYNEVGTGNYSGNRVVTGWKIVSVSGGTTSYSTGDDVEFNTDGSIKSTPYNFADRKCTDKDLYSESGRIFSQGAYWDVPDGVTSITIEPYWGKAAYLCDQYWNVVYSKDHKTAHNVTIPGIHYTNGNDYFIEGTWQKVYNSLDNAVNALSSNASHSVYDYAVVLVGNYHLVKQGAPINNGGKPFTVMSADFDYDNEPDYSFILQFSSRQNTAPIRFDFINIPGLGMAQKSYEATSMPNVGIFKPGGWFEITNTATILLGQFEYDRSNKVLAPLILHGGIIEQIVSNNDGSSPLSKTQYIHMGSNVWLANFSPGIHQDRTTATKHVPVSVTGGEYQEFHLTGMYRADASIYDDNAECYIHGGKFGEITGTGLEGIGNPTNHTKGNITWLIDQADITNFFGGGINAAKPSQGNIYTEITNSNVTLFCGGPKFGDMQSGKTVTTKATDCTFGTFFGAGYGGNSYNRFTPTNKTDAVNYEWNPWVNEHYKCEYSSASDKNGISTNFAYEFIPMSGGMTTNVARLFVNFLSFSLATTGNVTSTLTGCKVTGNFYGGGSLGKVNGNVSSTLTNCTLEQNAFGAGFSATLPTVEVMATGGFTTEPKYDPDGGVYSQGVFPGTTTYTWEHAASPSIDKDNHILYTTADLTTLGTVTGKATLTINGTTTVAKSVYGGGEESGVGDGTEGDGTEVIITSGTIGTSGKGGAEYGNVYGGGKGKADDVNAGLVKGNANVTISGTPTIYHNIYGGGAYGSVGTFTYADDAYHTAHPEVPVGMPTALATANTGACTVTITGGTIGSNGKENGMVFGSSRGDVAIPEGTPAVDPNDRMAWVNSTHVTIGDVSAETSPTIKGSVYGSGENGHTFQNTIVDIKKGIIGITDTNVDGGASYAYRGNVYGGGCGTDKYDSDGDETKDAYNPLAGIVRGTTTINITGGQIAHNVYGAGAMGSVGNASDATSGKTTINISGGRIGYDGDGNGHVFGAARGDFGISTAASGLANVRETEVNINYATTPGSDNEGKTEQLIAGSVFGGGEAGTVKGSVAVNMTGGLILNDIYGGGALADTQTSNWDPTASSGAGGWAEGKNSASTTTTVRLTGGTVLGEAYGGGLGETGKPAYVYGDVLLDLNGTTSSGEEGTALASDVRGCAVGEVFGCNNVAGTPKGIVLVHVYATQNKAKSQIGNTNGETPVTDAKTKGSYDVKAVYGGGNLAAYIPKVLTTGTTNVIIDGCGLTSIQTVYGGGNAASTPATNVTVNGTYEIEEVFGGGNGKDAIGKDAQGNDIPNPGANVGFYDYSAVETTYPTKEDRQKTEFTDKYVYGSGKASVNIFGGTIHRVFGGSNTKGNVRQTAVTMLEEVGGCDFCVDEAYGGGKSAPMDAEAKLLMACIPGLSAAYGGAEAADIRGDVTLNITNGTFDRVFGGNNKSGTIRGSITVNIQEVGCRPIIIGELYGGGNEAGYSVYGYNNDGSLVESGDEPLYADPKVNVKSFTSIGTVYGGGYGATAKMVGNPTVNVSVVEGAWKDYVGESSQYEEEGYVYDDTGYKGETLTIVDSDGTTTHDVDVPSHAKGKIGAINNVFGGGNAAPVKGNTSVNIGTLATVSVRDYVVKDVTVGASVEGLYTRSGAGTVASPYRYTPATGTAVAETTYYEEKDVEKDVVGVDIRGNVYGGGNNAEVTGNTNVNIGKKSE